MRPQAAGVERLASAAEEPSRERLWRAFENPSREFSPAPFWWWSGERLDAERLCWQLRQLAEGGAYQAVVLNLAPAGPMFGKDPDDPPFMSEEWWTIFRAVCAEAEALGMRIWYYDQIGFSGANIQGRLCLENERCRGMVLGSRTVEGTEAEFPPDAVPLAAFATGLGAGASVPREVPFAGRRVRLKEGGGRRLRLVYALWSGFDYLDPEACRLLLDRTHGEYERRVGPALGKVIAGSFQDELPSMPTWGRDFFQRFEERAGYDLRPMLWALWEGEDAEAQRVRMDYQRVRASLAEDAFFRPFYDWHDRHGMICGCDQQAYSRCGRPVDTVRQYADYLRTHRWYGAPGCDHHGEMRIHSSLARHYGRRRVWFEAFHSSGWGGTLEETLDWLLPWWLAGANLYNPHAVYYSTRGGWWEWAPPSTCWRQPYWRHYPHFAKAVSRIGAVLAEADHEVDVAVLHPTATVQAYLTLDGALPAASRADEAYRSLVGSMFWHEPRPGILDQLRLDFNVVDDAALQSGTVRGGKLAAGRAAYSIVILPGCAVLEEASARQLAAFVESGGRLLAVGAVPESGPLQAAFDAGRAVCVEKAGDLAPFLEEAPRRVTAPVPVRHLRHGGLHLALLPLAYPGATKQESAGNWWEGAVYTFDPARYARPLSVTIHMRCGRVEAWDPVSGARFDLPACPEGEGTRVALPEDAPPVVLLVWEPEASAPASRIAFPVWKTSLELPRTWRCTLVPTLDNRHGDFAWPAHAGAPPAQTVKFKHREEPEDAGEPSWWDGDWPEATFAWAHATYGAQGWCRGPVAAGDFASPLEGEGWRTAVYSLSRGIRRDAVHTASIGPSGHVPDEFFDFGPMAPGQAAQFATWVRMDEAREVHLAVAAPGKKSARVNGRRLEQLGRAYLWMPPMRLQAGWNQIEWRFAPSRETGGRCYWALVADPARFARPEFLTSADAPRAESSLRLGRNFDLPFAAEAGRLLIYSTGACRVFLDGAELGRQGGFAPYAHFQDVATVRKLGPLPKGRHRIELHAEDGARAVRLLADAEWRGRDGRVWRLASDEDWWVSRDGGPRCQAGLDVLFPVSLIPGSTVRGLTLERRPHPLPGAHWLETEPPDGTVLDVAPDPWRGKLRAEWFQWPLPPGAIEMRLDISGRGTLWINGKAVAMPASRVQLPEPDALRRTATLRVECSQAARGGGIFRAPVAYSSGPGRIELGDWCERGLDAYSGGVCHESVFTLAAADGRWLVDLGRVRGTAEVWINRHRAGVRWVAPYRLEITGLVKAGSNTIEILVLNTLAPYMAAHSPSRGIHPGQAESGLFGPVRILRAEA